MTPSKWTYLLISCWTLYPGLAGAGELREEVVIMEKDMRQVKIVVRCRALSEEEARLSLWITPLRDVSFKTAIHYLTKTPGDDFPISQTSRTLPRDNNNLPKITLSDITEGEYMVIVMINRRKKGSPGYFRLSLEETNVKSVMELQRK